MYHKSLFEVSVEYKALEFSTSKEVEKGPYLIPGPFNDHGNLYVKEENNKFYWAVENFDGKYWHELTKELYTELIKFKEEVSTMNTTCKHPEFEEVEVELGDEVIAIKSCKICKVVTDKEVLDKVKCEHKVSDYVHLDNVKHHTCRSCGKEWEVNNFKF